MARITRSLAITLITASLTTLTSCGTEGDAKDAVKRLLNDPDSARFEGLNPGVSKKDICGYVNAKNRMGGYVGNAPFFYEDSIRAATILAPADSRRFRMLWLGIKTSNFRDEMSELTMSCMAIDRWQPICGTSAPVERDPLCSTLLSDGKNLYQALKKEFDR